MAKAPEKVPRRMQRFYRNATKEKSAQQYSYDYGEPSYREEYNDYSGGLESAIEKLPPEGVREKRELEKIPTMGYEDLNIDEKNLRDLKRIEQHETDEKLALFEIEKFKREKKRMPTKEESQRLAENVYTQLSEEESYDEIGAGKPERRGRRGRRERPAREDKPRHEGRRTRENRKAMRAGPSPEPGPPGGGAGAIGDIKDLLGEGTGETDRKKIESEMDMGLGGLSGEDELGEIEELDFSLDNKKKKKKESL